MEGNWFPEPDTVCRLELTRSANCEDALPHSANVADEYTAWTDEKHNLYLYQLEMSFVKQLQQSKCLHAYQRSEQNQKDLNIPLKKFNISKNGFWQEISCVRAQKPELLKLCNTMKHGKRSISHGLSTSSQKFSPNKPSHEDLFGLAREGMGQNFLDGDDQRKSGFVSPTKRWKTCSALADTSSQDQIVPSRTCLAADYSAISVPTLGHKQPGDESVS